MPRVPCVHSRRDQLSKTKASAKTSLALRLRLASVGGLNTGEDKQDGLVAAACLLRFYNFGQVSLVGLVCASDSYR